MAQVSQLEVVSVLAPGFRGLNTQDSPVTMSSEFSLESYNAIADNSGRVSPRKGWTSVYNNLNSDIGVNTVKLVHEFIKTDGSTELVGAAGTSLFSLDVDTQVATTLYTDGTWTNSNWKAVNFNGKCYFFQRGHDPLVYDGTTVQKISASAGYTGAVPAANEVLSAYGRLWVADTTNDKLTITWSDTLLGNAWTGGTAGSLNLASVLTKGIRPIKALAAFNGNLIIFCDKSIIIYDGADVDPANNLNLVEVIDGVGALGRDCIQTVGNDIFYVSETGVRSLGRLVSEKSAPIWDISKNIRDLLILAVSRNADGDAVKTAYSDKEGLFILTLLNNSARDCTFVFDTKNPLEDNSRKASQWSLKPYAMATDSEKRLLFGFQLGHVGSYGGFTDHGSPYRFKYATSWLNGGNTSRYKILKNLAMIVVGRGGFDILVKWYVDYGEEFSYKVLALPNYGNSEYGIGEYNIAEYSGGNYRAWKLKTPLSKYGRVFQIAVEFDVVGPCSIQQIDAFVKPGRMSLQ